jgi:hypothetical protein
MIAPFLEVAARVFRRTIGLRAARWREKHDKRAAFGRFQIWNQVDRS